MRRLVVICGLFLAYAAGLVWLAVSLSWESDIIGGLLTLPVEVVFIAAFIDRLQQFREEREWSGTREFLVARSQELIQQFLNGIDQLSLAIGSAGASECATRIQSRSREWDRAYEDWLQSMQLNARCFSPRMARLMVALNHAVKELKNLYAYLEALARGAELQFELGPEATRAAVAVGSRFKEFEAVFEAAGAAGVSREIAAAVDSWALATNAIVDMYRAVGYTVSTEALEDGTKKVVMTRGETRTSVLGIGHGLQSTLCGMESALRRLPR